MSVINDDVKRLFYTLIGSFLILLFFIWAAANIQSLMKFSSSVVNTITGEKSYDQAYKYNLDKNKQYNLVIQTSLGTMTFSLDKNRAPDTVNNIVNLVKNDFYKNTNYKDYKTGYVLLGKGQNKQSVGYQINEEINYKSLGLDSITVTQDYDNLLKAYSNVELNQYPTVSVADFYKLKGYTNKDNVQSKPIKKGSLVMYSEFPGKFGNLFFISLSDTENSYQDGRMTNFGDLMSGSDVLDQISSGQSFNIVSISITEK